MTEICLGMSHPLEDRVKGTTIDQTTFLSTDYFNHFNEVIMLLGILPEMPDIIEEIDAWHFKTYEQHFRESGLPIAPLAIEAYAEAPSTVRRAFDENIEMMRMTVESGREELRELIADGDGDKIAVAATICSQMLQQLVEHGSSLVHGGTGSLGQSDIDALF